eukprot:6163840-Ditylum_brightwellii.AAC.1
MCHFYPGKCGKNYPPPLRQQDTWAVSHMMALPAMHWVHHVHTGLVEQMGPARQLKLPEGHPRPVR